MAEFLSDPAFMAMHLTPLRINYQPKEGKNVSLPIAGGKPMTGFYVGPKEGAHSAIIMVHEFWGLNDHIKKTAEMLHDQTGYAVLALDMYDGQVASTREDAGKFMSAVKNDRGDAIVRAAVAGLKSGALGFRPQTIGTIGYCFGGGWSFKTAVQGGKNINACVMYYGMPDMAPTALAAVKAPVLFVHPTKDRWITAKVAQDFKVAMGKLKKSVEVLHYDADHAFANPSNPQYDAKNANDALAKTLAFYKKHLK